MGLKNQRTGSTFKRGPRRNHFAGHSLIPLPEEPTTIAVNPIEEPVQPDDVMPDWVEPIVVEGQLPDWVDPEPHMPDWVEPEATPLPNAKGIEPIIEVKDLNPLPSRKKKK